MGEIAGIVKEKNTEKGTHNAYDACFRLHTDFRVCGGFICLFSFFIENTQEDIEYVLNSTSQQFQSHMQFIEDGAVSIRHNMMLNDFFDTGKSGADYDRTVAEPQLSYSMELFSDRNMINKKYLL
ncbi:hypothetical protein LC724_19140 [Blautia sp. RD014234]|nr:hypothetical protein [Blautia parvula]